MKKLISFLTDPYVLVPTLLGGVVGYYAKGREADGAGRYVWPAGGVAAGLTAGYMLRSRQEALAAAALALQTAEAAAKAPPLGAAAAASTAQKAAATAAADSPVAGLPPHVTLDDEYETEIDYTEDDGDIDVDDMFGDEGDASMPLEEYEPAPVAAPSAGYRGPEPAAIADATPTEEHAYRIADELAQEMGHGSLGDGNGVSDVDLAGGWGGYAEGTLDGDVDFDDLATGVPGMARGRNGHNN